jgi:Kyakuja-Dileera-Zisupton transposase
MVDLFKGEQQKNVDFALLQSLNILTIDPEQGLLFIYDIVCQYGVHLKERIGHLLPPGLTIDQAIDLFHVHDHKDDCFFRFATTFIPGAAVVAGQIIESLWSNLNSISPTVRTATLPHRAEMLDDHACDSNHKKMRSMTDNLQARYMDATIMVRETDIYYHEVTRTVDRGIITVWAGEVKAAEVTRLTDIKVMDIYAARLTDGYPRATPSASASGSATSTAPMDRWIEFALLVEEMQ